MINNIRKTFAMLLVTVMIIGAGTPAFSANGADDTVANKVTNVTEANKVMNVTAANKVTNVTEANKVTNVTAANKVMNVTATNKVMNDAAAVILKTVKNPVVDSVGGEWAVLGLARSGYDVPRSYYEGYYRTVEKYTKDSDGVLHDLKYTEYSRVILALTATGYDPRDIGGYDLTLPLGDFDKTIWQGLNGAAFALIALDSAGYDMPKNPDAKVQASRDMYIAEILRRQLSDGGFALSASGTSSDADITGMVLQALSKYQSRADVKTAINKALSCLSNMQENNGGIKSGDSENLEGIVQLIIALCELGIDMGDTRFVKNGNSLLDRLMDYYIPGKGFEHTLGGGINQMATEQATCALAAICRFESGMASLYDMKDSAIVSVTEKPSESMLPEAHKDVRQMPVTQPNKTFSDVSGHPNQNAIESLASREIISGMSNGTFQPDATMTRAQFAAIITHGLGFEQFNDTPFDDVAADAWYKGHVGAAYKYGIISGKSAVRFDPDGLISKQEAATMIAKASKLCGMDTEQSEQTILDMLAQFSDYLEVSGYARSPLAFCYANGILSQNELNIEAARNITRCEIAEMLYNMLDKAQLL